MRFTVIAVGKLKERFWKDACDEYNKRLQPYAHTIIKEVSDIDPRRVGGIAAAREREGLAILAAVPADTHVTLLAIEGEERSSVELSRRIDDLGMAGTSGLTFIIGGSDGVSDAVRTRADETLSLGRITLPHNLARVVLLEQLYRSQKISRKEPYHK